MKQEVIEKGIWSIEEFNHLKRNTITEINGYNGSNELRLSITQLMDRSSYQQNKLVKEWCKLLPTLKSVEYLWLPSRVNQKIFDSICRMPNLKSLWIKWSGIKSIEAIENLHKLEHLHIGSSSQIEIIEPISKLKNLITLETENLKRISNFDTLSELTQLQGLGIDGSIWGTQKIDSLDFVKSLTELKYFTMTNSSLISKSFEPLFSLNSLIRFNTSWNYPEKELEKLKQHPTLKYGNIETSWNELKADLTQHAKENGW